jgi:hypothetical protein
MQADALTMQADALGIGVKINYALPKTFVETR